MAQKNVSTKSDYMSMDECKRLAECLSKEGKFKWELYIRLSISTALRVSDILSVKWEDILDNNSVTIIEKKTGKKRKVYLSDEVNKTAKKVSKLEDSNTGFIFTNRKGDVISRQYINQILKKFKAKYNLKVDNFSTHSLRKSFCREFWELENRSDSALILLSTILEHSSTKVTRAYLGIQDEEIEEVYIRIQDRLYGKR